MPDSAFRVKLLQLWTFPGVHGSRNWNGVWETMAVHNPGTEDETFDLRRACVTGDDQILNEIIHKRPTWFLLECGHCHKLTPIYKQNAPSN